MDAKRAESLYHQAISDIESLQEKIIELRGNPDDPVQPPVGLVLFDDAVRGSLVAPNVILVAEIAAQTSPRTAQLQGFKVLRRLTGHFGKVYALAWGGDSVHLASASQDGRLIIWNGKTQLKTHVVNLKSAWVMACAYSPDCSLVAAGGLDNLCSIYKLPTDGKDNIVTDKAEKELGHHEGYLSDAKFLDRNTVITSSGDSTCILWDVNRAQPTTIFTDHTADVMSISVCEEKGIFVSGSVDCTAKMWDHRMRKAVTQTFPGHDADINSVSFFPDGHAFASGSDDSSCRLFDTRAYRQLNRYYDDKLVCGVTSVSCSKSGQWIFAGYDEPQLLAWDSLTAKVGFDDGFTNNTNTAHENRISCLEVSPDGKALVTGSWDFKLLIWA